MTVKYLIEQGYEVYIATASDVRNMKWKEELLQKYFPFVPTNNLIRIHNKAMLNVDVLIEDNLDTLKSSLAERVCLNQPWNIDDGADYVYGIYRAHCWSDIINITELSFCLLHNTMSTYGNFNFELANFEMPFNSFFSTCKHLFLITV